MRYRREEIEEFLRNRKASEDVVQYVLAQIKRRADGGGRIPEPRLSAVLGHEALAEDFKKHLKRK